MLVEGTYFKEVTYTSLLALFIVGLGIMHMGFATHEELFIWIGALFWMGVGTMLHQIKNHEPPHI